MSEQDLANGVIALTLAVTGVVLIVLGRRSRAHLIPRNWIVGVRTKTTMRSDETWRVAQEAAGPTTTAAGAVSIVDALVVAVAWPRTEAGLVAGVVPALSLVLILVLIGGVRAQRAARDVES